MVWPVPHHTEAEKAAVVANRINASKNRSAACSQCGASDVVLSRCAKCKLACYCSGECQRANWGVHKPQCRAPGEHRAGDVVMLHNARNPSMNGQWFLVVERDPQRPGHWAVQNVIVNGGTPLSVQQDSMRHVLTH